MIFMVMTALYFYYPDYDWPCTYIFWIFSPSGGVFLHMNALRYVIDSIGSES
jgi:hypothetical protein